MGTIDSPLILWSTVAATGMSVLLAGRAMMSMAASDAVADASSLSPLQQASRRHAMENSILFRCVIPPAGFLGALTRRVNLAGIRGYLGVPYAKAGFPGGMTNDELLGTAILIGLISTGFFSLVFGLLGAPWMAPLGIIGFPVGTLLIVTNMQGRIETRELMIQRMMPYALDLMVLCLKSGISLNLALQKVVEDHRRHPIGEELGQVLTEIGLGVARSKAFENLADRIPAEDMRAFCDTVIQAEELGWPLSEVLSQLADRVMAERVLSARAKAGAAGVLIMLPSALFMIAALLVLFGPIIARFLAGGMSVN